MTTTALVVEKETGPGSVLELVAKHESWTVERAESAQAALDRLAAEEFEVLIADTDAVRDRKGWLDFVRERYPNLPVVLVTPHARHDATVQALLLGAATFVPRDRLARDLVTTIERIVALSCVDEAPPVGKTLTETAHRYVFPNDRTAVPPVLRHVQTELERFAVCDRPDRLRVAVALEEALVNAIVHGNLEVPSKLRERGDDSFERAIMERKTTAPYSDRRARLAATFRPGEVTFVVADEGPGFDPTDVPDPTDPENLAKPHGRGLLLMRTFMDEAHHNVRGNEVTLVKRARI
jgi:anti-sigma regulatory factor (Ser/Thr protein kinase)/CheY-like chemotaxis protein